MDEYYAAAQCLPGWLSVPLCRLPQYKAAGVQEIRLWAGQPPALTAAGRPVSAALYDSALAPLGQLRLTAAQIKELLLHLCGQSFHAYEDQLSHGFITLPGGQRVGVGGKYVSSAAVQYALLQPTSLNLRIPRARTTAIPPGMHQLLQKNFGGLVLIGEPGSGKTTVLRSIAVQLQQLGRLCCLLDEREELAGGDLLPQTGAIDRISGIPKASAAQMALRALAPQVILLDELGELDEVNALRQALACGVDFVATMHAATLQQLQRRPQFRLLQASGMVQTVCRLHGREAPGRIAEVIPL